MHGNFQPRGFTCCAICGGRFGLVRYYSCWKAICSKRCAGRFWDRRENDRKWLMPFADLVRAAGDGRETYQGLASRYL
jgi:hypothetical protein